MDSTLRSRAPPMQAPFATSVEGAPDTIARPVPLDLPGIDKPWVARANAAPDLTHPQGTPNWHQNESMSVLQQHVRFFDRDGDGEISMTDTFLGFRALGFNVMFSLLAVFIINVNFAYFCQDSWIPDPRFRIKIKNIHRAKHGSDTGVIDTEGRFIPSKFEEIFTKFAKTNPNYLTLREVYYMTSALRNAGDPFGWFANKFEWFTLVLLVGTRAGPNNQLVITKEHIRAQYDGSLFYLIEAERRRLARSTGPVTTTTTTAVRPAVASATTGMKLSDSGINFNREQTHAE